MIKCRYKRYTKEISIKNRVCNYYFDNLVRARKLEITNILIDEKIYKYSIIYFIFVTKDNGTFYPQLFLKEPLFLH